MTTFGVPRERLGQGSRGEDERILAAFEVAISDDDGHEAKKHLAAGRPIYIGDEAYAAQIIRAWPSGQRELIAIDAKHRIAVIRKLDL